jgi:hypothetical protein
VLGSNRIADTLISVGIIWVWDGLVYRIIDWHVRYLRIIGTVLCPKPGSGSSNYEVGCNIRNRPTPFDYNVAPRVQVWTDEPPWATLYAQSGKTSQQVAEFVRAEIK